MNRTAADGAYAAPAHEAPNYTEYERFVVGHAEGQLEPGERIIHTACLFTMAISMLTLLLLTMAFDFLGTIVGVGLLLLTQSQLPLFIAIGIVFVTTPIVWVPVLMGRRFQLVVATNRRLLLVTAKSGALALQMPEANPESIRWDDVSSMRVAGFSLGRALTLTLRDGANRRFFIQPNAMIASGQPAFVELAARGDPALFVNA